MGGPSSEPPDRVLELIEPAAEVRQQTRLAHACVTDDGDHLPLALLYDLVEAILQATQLDLPADRARLHPLDTACVVEVEPTSPLALDQVAVDRLGEAFELQTGHRLHVERAADVAVRVGGDQHAAAWCRALQAGGPIDDVAHHHELLPRLIAERAHDDLPGVDADAHLQVDVVRRGDLGVDRYERCLHRKSRADGPVGILLLRPVQAEHGHHGVADELLDDPTVGLDELVRSLEVGVDDGAHVLGVEALRQDGEVDEVGEQHRDELALFGDAAGHELGPSGDQRLDGGVHDGVAEQGALRFERANSVIDRPDIRLRHCCEIIDGGAQLLDRARRPRPSAAAPRRPRRRSCGSW